MASRIRVGVACPRAGERAAFLEWLDAAGYEPVPMVSLDAVSRALETGSLEALIADAALVPAFELPRVTRTLGGNRPLVLVGEPGTAPERTPCEAGWMDRPVANDTFLMSVALALAEGRPARRYPRRAVARLRSSIDGVTAVILDVSVGGLRLEVAGTPGVALPPFFSLRVPAFGVATTIKRIWVTTPGNGRVWCGGTLEREAPPGAPWREFVEAAPAPQTEGVVSSSAVPFL